MWLCELRLWLSVVIESADDDIRGVLPLPNLDRNIRVGDSLGRSSRCDARPTSAAPPRCARLATRYAKASGAKKATLAPPSRESSSVKRALDVVDADLAIAQRHGGAISLSRAAAAICLASAIEPRAEERRAARGYDATRRAFARRDDESPAAVRCHSRSSVHFADVAARGGFDIMIGNPAVGAPASHRREQRARFRRDFDVARHAGMGARCRARRRWTPVRRADRRRRAVRRALDPSCSLQAESSRSLLARQTLALARRRRRAAVIVRRTLRRARRRSFRCAGDVRRGRLSVARRAPRRRQLAHGDDDVDVVVHRGSGGGCRWRDRERRAAVRRHAAGAPWLLLPPDARRAFDALRDVGHPLAEARSAVRGSA